jgi:hypothetical protein
MIDPIALASITSAVSVLGNEFLKGIAGEAGKSTWAKIKTLFNWQSEPEAEDIPHAVATALTQSPQLAAQILDLLKQQDTGSPSAMVGNIHAEGGKVVVAQTIITSHFQM